MEGRGVDGGRLSRIGAWTARAIGVAFVLSGLGAVSGVLVLWVRIEPWGFDLVGTMMVLIGGCQIALRENSRKAGIVIGLANACGSIWALSSIARFGHGRAAMTTNVVVAVVMAGAAVALMLPTVRDAFARNGRRAADDEEPLLGRGL